VVFAVAVVVALLREAKDDLGQLNRTDDKGFMCVGKVKFIPRDEKRAALMLVNNMMMDLIMGNWCLPN
jgi:hypothetical protein